MGIPFDARETIVTMSYEYESESRRERRVRRLIGWERYRPQFLPPCKRDYGLWPRHGSAGPRSSTTASARRPWSSPLYCWCSDSDAATRIYRAAIPSYWDSQTCSPAVPETIERDKERDNEKLRIITRYIFFARCVATDSLLLTNCASGSCSSCECRSISKA